MLLRRTSSNLRFLAKNVRKISVSSCVRKDVVPPEDEDPIKRTIRILKDDIKRPIQRYKNLWEEAKRESASLEDLEVDPKKQFQSHCDVLVIGGGAMGSSAAYWLKKRAREGLNVVVVEKDPTYATASTPLSVGGLRQQFSIEENVMMSLFGAEFLRNIKQELGDDVDVNFNPYGYMMLASEEGAETLIENSKMQNELGARNEILTAEQIKRKFPWINTEGIAVGCHGLEKEGWFDPWSLLCAFKNRAIEYGAHYTQAEVVGFQIETDETTMSPHDDFGHLQKLDKAIVKMPNGEIRTIKFAICVLAAGAQSGKIAKMANIGTGRGVLNVPLPVEPRKHK
ncbi:FAD-dependent oxidoreductase domain-containing protein 1-like [Culicoides brevitarsis]|uniref:FAD-dependent oxidoreductase domain-containing protein 1-like n=1 Tax=Culicoides brevitarsis TaxID=469753 RepID=UPI00307B7F40